MLVVAAAAVAADVDVSVNAFKRACYQDVAVDVDVNVDRDAAATTCCLFGFMRAWTWAARLSLCSRARVGGGIEAERGAATGTGRGSNKSVGGRTDGAWHGVARGVTGSPRYIDTIYK